MKRLFDLLASAAALVLLSPFLLMIAFLVKLSSRGPALYRAERVGLDGKVFDLYKFRTMLDGADTQGPKITARDDPRITSLGRVLRRLKIDELLQLINVLKGEMSLVGPRPENPHFVAHYAPEQRKVLSVLPGITSPASLKYRHEERLLHPVEWERTYLEEILPEKLRIELDYLETKSFKGDLKIIIFTLLSLLR